MPLHSVAHRHVIEHAVAFLAVPQLACMRGSQQGAVGGCEGRVDGGPAAWHCA